MDPFPDLSAQNAIISDACGGAITLSDQSFIVQAVQAKHAVYTLSCATEDACTRQDWRLARR